MKIFLIIIGVVFLACWYMLPKEILTLRDLAYGIAILIFVVGALICSEIDDLKKGQ